jgi:hypothetical protein
VFGHWEVVREWILALGGRTIPKATVTQPPFWPAEAKWARSCAPRTGLGARSAYRELGRRSLKTVVRIMLTLRYAMWMGWGPELTFFYNDAYRPTLGVKHPEALGMPAHRVWAEIWKDNRTAN